MEGTQVSSYLLEEKIGVGGFGTVYAAKHVDLPDIKVAVKLMHAHHSSDVEYIKNLKQECMVLHKLQHPNIVGFREFVINNDPPAIIMEFLKGEDAEERAKHTPFSLEEITKIAIDSLHALDYAHQKKIIHRDIKPSNLFICTDGSIKVADFGIAKAFDSQNQTETGILKGTLNYMAPELFGSNPVTGAADIYALGLSLWELLVGNIACPSGSLMTKVNWHMNHLISDIRLVRPDIPNNVASIIMKMCAADLAERPNTAKEALDMWLNKDKMQALPWFLEMDENKSISRKDGIPSGKEVSVLLRKYHFHSIRIGVEVVQKLVPILRYAHESSFFHGDLDGTDIYLSSFGQISMAFPASPNTTSRAPETNKIRRQTDIYGLGVILLNILAEEEAVYPPHEEHDTYIEEQFSKVEWGKIASEEWFPSVRSFFVRMFHLDPVQRPDLNEIETVCKKILPLLEGEDLQVLSLKMDEISSEILFVNSIPKVEPAPVVDDFEDDEQTVLMSREDQVKSPEPSPLSKRKYVRIMFVLYALLMVWVTYKFINSLDKEHSHSEQQKLEAQLKELESQAQLYNIELPSPPYKKEMVRVLKWLIERETSFLAKEKEIALEKKYIPRGTFPMGCSLTNPEECAEDTLPKHYVTLSKPLYIMKSEVTQKLYSKLVEANPSHFNRCGDDCPVESISWYEAVQFANALNERVGLEKCYDIGKGAEPPVKWDEECVGWRLPTEAEWEYAARGKQEFQFSGSNDLDLVAWYQDNSQKRTHPVCQKSENAFELCDMSGNVLEWVWDTKGRLYKENAVDPVYVSPQTTERGVRGGGWIIDREMMNVSTRYFQQTILRASKGFVLYEPFPSLRTSFFIV